MIFDLNKNWVVFWIFTRIITFIFLSKSEVSRQSSCFMISLGAPRRNRVIKFSCISFYIQWGLKFINKHVVVDFIKILCKKSFALLNIIFHSNSDKAFKALYLNFCLIIFNKRMHFFKNFFPVVRNIILLCVNSLYQI